jgi:hypothetical protein
MIPIGTEREIYHLLNRTASRWIAIRRRDTLTISLGMKEYRELGSLIERLELYGEIIRGSGERTPELGRVVETIKVMGDIDSLFDILSQLEGRSNYIVHAES